MSTLDVIGYTSVAASIWTLYDITRLHGHAWAEADSRRWAWVLVTVAAFPFLLGIPVGLLYALWIRPGVARADRDCILARRSGKQAARAARPARASAGASGGTMADKLTASAPPQRCSLCQSGKIPCTNCGGRGTMYDGQVMTGTCWSCSGTGKTTCNGCSGSGYRK